MLTKSKKNTPKICTNPISPKNKQSQSPQLEQKSIKATNHTCMIDAHTPNCNQKPKIDFTSTIPSSSDCRIGQTTTISSTSAAAATENGVVGVIGPRRRRVGSTVTGGRRHWDLSGSMRLKIKTPWRGGGKLQRKRAGSNRYQVRPAMAATRVEHHPWLAFYIEWQHLKRRCGVPCVWHPGRSHSKSGLLLYYVDLLHHLLLS